MNNKNPWNAFQLYSDGKVNSHKEMFGIARFVQYGLRSNDISVDKIVVKAAVYDVALATPPFGRRLLGTPGNVIVDKGTAIVYLSNEKMLGR